ncbi:TPA: formate--phosphoribosylaminoimidazolecarboxamide ligase [Candidatus Micrarchaeota archaeon]|nr:formate--phosphoribosylaminoimidazolecarboxamide ligase [Candidatus Micrarchaeota archaeon]
MALKDKISDILDSYKKFTIATICSHSSLQIFHGARKEGIKTIGIVKKDRKTLYESFPYGKPDEFIVVDDYSKLPVSELVARNAIVVPHGSFVEYVGEAVDKMEIPIYGNRASLAWERSREKMFEWMHKAGVKTPRILKPEEIDGPALVKFPGAKGGKGYFIVNSQKEFEERMRETGNTEYMIQEFIIGVRAYPHFFFTPFGNSGYKTAKGRIELLGMDKRVESSADEIARAVSAGLNPRLSFTVTGNEPIVLRESLLSDYMEIGRKISDTSFGLFGGMFGPYCVETIINDDLEIFAFEISARIVAGTNVYPEGSPYSIYYHKEPMSMGRRIAKELKIAKKKGKLTEIVF